MGLYTTRFSTTTEAPGCSQRCYDTGARIRARSTDLGFHVFAGGEFRITANDAFAAELRYLQLDADFGTTLPGKTKVGGAFLWAGYRRAFF